MKRKRKTSAAPDAKHPQERRAFLSMPFGIRGRRRQCLLHRNDLLSFHRFFIIAPFPLQFHEFFANFFLFLF